MQGKMIFVLVAVALLSHARVQANDDATVLKLSKRNSCPSNAEFTAGPGNVTFIAGQEALLSCSQVNFFDQSIVWHQYFDESVVDEQPLETIRSSSTDSEINGFFYQVTTGQLKIRNVTARHQGVYQCGFENPCGSLLSPIGFIKVMSAIQIDFVDPSDEFIIIELKEPGPTLLDIEMRMFGSPSPTLTLYKQTAPSVKRSIDFKIVNDPLITVNMSGVFFSSVDFQDEGEYRLEAENIFNTTSISFTVRVKGVDPPIVTLNESMFTPESYGNNPRTVLCSLNKNAFDSDSGQLTLDWYHESNIISDSPDMNVYQTKPNETTILLNINRLEEANNGDYVCMAKNEEGNSTGNFTVVGPPAAVSDLTHHSFENGIELSWIAPELYGATLIYYNITYTKQGRTRTVRVYDPPRTQNGRFRTNVPNDLCPVGTWNVSILAVNEYDGTGVRGNNIQVEITRSAECDSTISARTASSTRDNSRSTQSNSNGGGMSTRSTPTEPSSAPSSAASSLPIAAGAAVGAFILIVLVAVLVFVIACYITVSRRGSKSRAEQRWNQNGYPSEQLDNGYVETNTMPNKSPDSQLNAYEVAMPSPLGVTPGYAPIYIDPRYEFPRENLELTDILYDGAFTVIYKAKAIGIKDGKPIDVAVKSLKEEYLDYDDYSSALIMEMEQLAQLEPHQNIVGLVRVCSVSRPVLMVMEYMCHGDLLGFLRTTRGYTDMYTVNPGMKNLPTHLKLTSRDLLSIIKQVATGMQFLSEQKIVHGALCARNILVSTSMEVKIFNIGVHNLDNDESLESLVRWMAPEVFVDGVRTSYGDIWSFGVLMWEVVTLGGTPYSEMGTEDLYTQLMSGVRLQKPPHCAQAVYDVMTTCWETIPQHRPQFFEINDHLQNMNLSKMSYLDLRNYNETAYSQFDESERQQTSIL